MERVRILKPCYSVHLHRYVREGEIVENPTLPRRAIQDGLVELVVGVPENVPDMPGTYD